MTPATVLPITRERLQLVKQLQQALRAEERTTVRIKGRDVTTPSVQISNRTLVCTGQWLKTAMVQDEAFVQGEIVPDPQRVIRELKQWAARPDLFTFSQKIGEAMKAYPYHVEWDNFAVIRITAYNDWLKKVKKDVRENLRRAKREEVDVRIVAYDEAFVRGIKALYDETPIRQGKRFWHYGKSIEALREIHGTYAERAGYLGAYLGDELIGFIKMVYVDNYAKTMHVISKESHWQRRPTNALIAKAVEVCVARGLEFFIYGEYNFPGKRDTSLTEFKRRHGFEEVLYPRYYAPLTVRGRLALRLGLHRGWQRYMPSPITKVLLNARAAYYRHRFAQQLAVIAARSEAAK